MFIGMTVNSKTINLRINLIVVCAFHPCEVSIADWVWLIKNKNVAKLKSLLHADSTNEPHCNYVLGVTVLE